MHESTESFDRAGNRGHWPAGGTEAVHRCPVCQASERNIVHGNLTDEIFFCAPGAWTLYRCSSCGSAYLDARPTKSTIGLAYQNYFTHEQSTHLSSLSFLQKVRLKLANGYRNWKFGTNDHPASFLGVLVALLLPNRRAQLDASMRHLPKAQAGQCILDVGCGSGAFLIKARIAGWETVGIDFDPKAIEVARKEGLTVHLGGIEVLDPSAQQFDVITLSHVIEHVHEPIDLLRACYKLLKKGGMIWVETPNIDAQGHDIFQKHWRGLEPPRHLVLFNLPSLQNAMKAAGFTEIEVQPYRPLCKSIFRASTAIAQGIDAYSDAGKSLNVSADVALAEQRAKDDPSRREFLTLKGHKIKNHDQATL